MAGGEEVRTMVCKTTSNVKLVSLFSDVLALGHLCSTIANVNSEQLFGRSYCVDGWLCCRNVFMGTYNHTTRWQFASGQAPKTEKVVANGASAVTSTLLKVAVLVWLTLVLHDSRL